MINLKNTEIGYRFFNFKEYRCFYCFDNLTFGAFKKFCKCLNEIEQSSVEISLPKNVSKEKVEKNLGFTFQNKWYKSKVKKNIDTTFNKNVFLIEDRKQIADLIKSKQLECANRKPEKFDKNKQDENWIEFGKEALALKLDGKILSILTFTEEENKNLEKIYHQTVKKVTNDYETLNFNTAISQLMIFVNAVYKEESFPKEYKEGFIKMLNPVCPYITEEIWTTILGHEGTITYSTWPTYDEEKTKEETKTIAVQVNGKVRASITIKEDESEESIKEKAMNEENIKKHLEGKTILKTIIIKNKIVNIVAK